MAPFVEEAAKATVLFWLAILMRYQWVSRLSGIVLAGLSGAAFAFTENILYYGRVYRYAARTFGQVPPLEALQDLFFLRGVMTFFGHPLFTAMTGIGLAVALRSKSKIVRVVAPLAGYCAAAFLHMAFNTTASLVSGTSLLFIYLGVALPLVIGMIIFVVRQLFREGPADPGTADRLRPAGLAARVRPGGAVPAADPAAGPLARRLPRPGRLPGHHPDAARGHRTGLPAGRDDPRPGRRHRSGAGEGAAGHDPRGTRLSRRAARGPGALPVVPPPARGAHRRTRRPASPVPAGLGGNYPAPTAAACAAGADCYPVLRGRPQLETAGRVGGRRMVRPPGHG